MTQNSSPLPLFDAVVKDKHANTIFDSGATSCFISNNFAKSIDLAIKNIKPRHVQVTDKKVLQSIGMTTFKMKLGNLPPENITAYVFPLQKLNLDLGLPWLERQNPHVDFRTMCFEFIRNGHTYNIYPSMPALELKIASSQEFINSIDNNDDEYIFYIFENPPEEPLKGGKEPTHECKAAKYARKIKR